MFLFTQHPNLLWYTLSPLPHEYRRLFPGGKETGDMKPITYIHLKVKCSPPTLQENPVSVWNTGARFNLKTERHTMH
jgi:hypothetical protein